MTCESVQDLLPDLAGGHLSGDRQAVVEAHVAGCTGCREILSVLALLAADPPGVPAGLESRIRAAARAELRPGGIAPVETPPPRIRRRGWHLFTPAWGLAAAAALALLMGRTLLPGGGPEPELLALGQEELPLLLADDGMVAGGPVLDGLSDDDLALLLEELER